VNEVNFESLDALMVQMEIDVPRSRSLVEGGSWLIKTYD